MANPTGYDHCASCGCWRPATDFPTNYPEVTTRRTCEVCKRPKPRVRKPPLTPEERRARRRAKYRRQSPWDPWLPAEPLQKLVERRLGQGASQAAVAARVGVDARAVRHLAKQRFVRLDKADRWALALGADLSELYPC